MSIRIWMASAILALGLWPAIAHGQSSALSEAASRTSALRTEGRYQAALWNYARLLRLMGRYAEAKQLDGRRRAVRGKRVKTVTPSGSTVRQRAQAALEEGQKPYTKRYTAAELRTRAYDQLMRKALGDRVGVLRGEGYGAKKGEVNPYRRTNRDKVLAICVDWIASTPDFFVGRTWNVHVGSNRDTRRTTAMFYCKKSAHARRQSCTCVFVDENDRNVLQLPKEFLARYAKP